MQKTQNLFGKSKQITTNISVELEIQGEWVSFFKEKGFSKNMTPGMQSKAEMCQFFLDKTKVPKF